MEDTAWKIREIFEMASAISHSRACSNMLVLGNASNAWSILKTS